MQIICNKHLQIICTFIDINYIFNVFIESKNAQMKKKKNPKKICHPDPIFMQFTLIHYPLQGAMSKLIT